MNGLPQEDAFEPQEDCPEDQEPVSVSDELAPAVDDASLTASSAEAVPIVATEQTAAEAPYLPSFFHPPLPRPVRIPHLGHLGLLMVFATIGIACARLLGGIGFHFHLFGVTNIAEMSTEIHYTLGFEAILYLVTIFLSILFFPTLWGKGFFAGIQWQVRRALRLRWRLVVAVLGCFVIAVLDMIVLPGKTHAPITEMFSSASAAWLMFGFGITFAPFFEELAFRGFLLPALCTAWDWSIERSTGKEALPLDADGHPRWSFFAMAVGSILTSLPFALIHVEQQGHALGPFVLIIAVSLVLCAVRLGTRSLAACTLVHAGYNFMLFFFIMVGTDGFRHLDKM